MKLNYYLDTDSLYIDLVERPSVESKEISEGIVLSWSTPLHWERNLLGGVKKIFAS